MTPNTTPNLQPLFGYIPLIAQNQITGTNPGHDFTFGGTGIMTTIASGNNFGTRIELINIIATGTTTAGMVRLFIDNSKTNGFYPNTGIRLWKETPITATVASSSAQAFTNELVRTDGRPLLILPSGIILSATAEKAEGFNIICFGADF